MDYQNVMIVPFFSTKTYEGFLWDVCHKNFNKMPLIDRENQKNAALLKKKTFQLTTALGEIDVLC